MKTMTIFLIIAISLCSTHARSSSVFPMPIFSNNNFASPSVKVILNGKEFNFLVDSGAPLHVIDESIAEKLGLNGVASTSLQLGEMTQFKNQLIISQNLPSDFKKSNLAGLLSPQMLASSISPIVMNIKGQKLEVAQSHIIENFDWLKVETVNGPNSVKLKYFFAKVSINNMEEKGLIDTGAGDFIVDLKSKLGEELLKEAIDSPIQIGDLYNTDTKTYVIRNKKIKIHDKNIFVDLYLKASHTQKPGNVIIGMKYLKDCKLVFFKDRSGISCN